MEQYFPSIERTAMAEKSLYTLFHDTLKDIYYAERTILKALPKMAQPPSRRN